MEFEFDAPHFCDFTPNKDLAYFDVWKADINFDNPLDAWFQVLHEKHYIPKPKGGRNGSRLDQFNAAMPVQRLKGEMRPKARKRKQIISDQNAKNVVQNESTEQALKRFKSRRSSVSNLPRTNTTIPVIASAVATSGSRNIKTKQTPALMEGEIEHPRTSSVPLATKKPRRQPDRSASLDRKSIQKKPHEDKNENVRNKNTDTTATLAPLPEASHPPTPPYQKHRSRISLNLRSNDLQGVKSDNRRHKSLNFSSRKSVGDSQQLMQQQLEHRRRISTRAISEECSVKEFEKQWEKANGVKLYMLDYQKRKEIRHLFLDHSVSPDRKH